VTEAFPSAMRSALFVSGARLLRALLTVTLGVLSASYFGASVQKDCYVVAQAIPALITTLLAGGVYGNLLVSLAEIAPSGAAAQRAFAWRTLGRLSLIFGPLTLVPVLLPRPLVAAFAPGFGPGEVELGADLLRLTAWSMLTTIAFTALRCPFETRSRFGGPSIASLLMGAVPVIVLLAGAPRLGIFALAAGPILGAMLGALLLAFLGPLTLRDPAGFTPQPRTLAQDAMTHRRFWTAFVPLTVGSAFGQVNLIVDNAFASFLPAGSITLLGFATVILSNAELLTALSLAEVAFPRLAAASRTRPTALAETFRNFARYGLIATAPVAAGLIVFGRPLARLLFERGQFGPDATEVVTTLLAIYSPKIIGVGWIALCSIVLMTQRRLRTILGIVITVVAANALLDALLVGPLGVHGIALATTLVVALQSAILWRAVRVSTGPIFMIEDRGFALRVAAAAALMAGVVFGWVALCETVADTGSEPGRLLEVLVGLAVGAGTYTGFLLLLGVRQVGDLIRQILVALRLSRPANAGTPGDVGMTP